MSFLLLQFLAFFFLRLSSRPWICQLLERGIVASVSQFIPQEQRAGTPLPRPSLRIIVCSHHSQADVQALVAALKELGGGSGGAVEAAAAPAKLDSARKRKTQKA